MRHQKHHASLGVTREHRAAMLSNLAAALITHGRIQTTLTKARALRPFIEKVITKAKHAAAKTEKKDAVHLRRLALRDVRDEDAVTPSLQREVQGVLEPRRRLHPHLQARAAAPRRRRRDGADRVRQGRRHGLQEVEGQEILVQEGAEGEGRGDRGRSRREAGRGRGQG
jgi:ribosomal protein L17